MRGWENFFHAFSEEINHSTVHFTYANAAMLKSQSMPYSGDLPTAEDEIVVQESFLDSLGYSDELGQTINIPFQWHYPRFQINGNLDVKTGDIWTLYRHYIKRTGRTAVGK